MPLDLLLHPLDDIRLKPDTDATADLDLARELILSNELVQLRLAKTYPLHNLRQSQELHLVVVLHVFLRVLFAREEI
jgi:hypothetical protein